MPNHTRIIPLLALAFAFVAQPAFGKTKEKTPAADSTDGIDTSAFKDSAQHWYNVNPDGADRVIHPLPGRPTYKKNQVREIAENVLLFQRANGIWPKNYDYTAILTPGQRKAVVDSRKRDDTTIDNNNTHTQIVYLARAYTLHKDERYRAACERAFDAILTAQYPNGGFPQIWPKATGYHTFITYNDGVMIGMLNLLRDIAEARRGFEWIDTARREKARAALAKGIDCVLATQYTNAKGVLQGWGQQHDPKTMKPGQARKYEFPCLCSVDTAQVVSFLMEIEKPDERVIRAVKAGVAWMEAAKITGKKWEEFSTVDSKTGKKVWDKRLVDDPNAKPMWARMYELETGRPMFGGRDGIRRYNVAEVDYDRRNGYGWFNTQPAKILEKGYAEWAGRNGILAN